MNIEEKLILRETPAGLHVCWVYFYSGHVLTAQESSATNMKCIYDKEEGYQSWSYFTV